MRSVFGRERGFFDRFMLWMRERMEKGMVTGVFPVTFPVFAGPCFDRGFCLTIPWVLLPSW